MDTLNIQCQVKKVKVKHYLHRNIPCDTKNDTDQVQISCYLIGGRSKKGASTIFGTFLFFEI